MGLTISEEQEREDRAFASCLGPTYDMAQRLFRAYAEIDALRERLAKIDRPCVIRSGHEREDLLAHGDVVLCGTEFMAALHEEIAALRDRVKTLEPYARFGSKAFEFFWHDAEPGDVDASDAQEMAVQAGLLRRRAPEDVGLSCCEYCDWQPGQPVEECSCLFPTLAPLKEADRG